MSGCGTYGGYKAHRKRGENACGPCSEALREYQAAWRKRNPKREARSASRQMARDRALRQLARLYPATFRDLYKQELDALPKRGPVMEDEAAS